MLVPPFVSAGSTDDSNPTKYYRESDKPGYYWHKDQRPAVVEKPDPKAPVKPKEEEAKPEPQVKKEPTRRLPKMADYTKQMLWDMHPDDFQALLEDFKKKAVMTLTEKDIGEYLEMQDLARRKALAYTNVSQMVVQKRPEISLEKDYPTADPGKYGRAGVANSEREDRINASRDNFALLYFYRNDCQYCNTQSEVMRMFVRNHGWTVRPVNIAEAPILATKFNVTIVPTVVLIKKGVDDFTPIATGVVALNQIDIRVFSGIRLMNGEIKPEQYFMGDFERGGGFDPLAPLQQK
jgi:conjugal transfer pilus assembly protein TraF